MYLVCWDAEQEHCRALCRGRDDDGCADRTQCTAATASGQPVRGAEKRGGRELEKERERESRGGGGGIILHIHVYIAL